MNDAERTEAPTPKRLNDARRDGDVLQSRDLSTALVVGGGLVALVFAGALIIEGLRFMLQQMLHFSRPDIVDFSPADVARESIARIAGPVTIVLVPTLVACLATPVLLGSLGFRVRALRPQWSRINPVAGLGRMFGGQAAAELMKSVAKVVLVGSVCVVALIKIRWSLVALGATDVQAGASSAGAMLIRTLCIGGGMLAIVALVDVLLQRQRRNKRLAMSRDAVTRENREADGAPELKRERRSRQYALATMSARTAMTDATVVLTNPTHFAVALRYHPETDAAPIVVARGIDEAAEAIRDLARGQEVPLLEYPVLTRALYFTSKVGDRVDQELYLAVATVLAFVMNLEAAMVLGRIQPEIDVPEALRFQANGRRDA